MKRYRLSLAMAACCGVALLNLAARAAEDVLTLVPDDALAVAVVNRIGQTQEKLETLGKQLQVPGAESLRGSPMSIQGQPHVDPQGTLAIAAVPDPDGQRPTVVGFVPMKDYQAFLKQFQSEDATEMIARITLGANKFAVAKKGSYAVLTAESDRKTLEKVLAGTRHVAAATAALTDWRAENDAYAVALPSGIKFAQQQLLIGLAMGKAQLAQQGEQGKVALAGLEMYESLFKALDKEITHCALGVRLRKDGGVQVVSRTLLAAGGVTLAAAKATSPAQGDLLAGLPRGPFVFAGGGIVPQAWMERLMGISVKMMKMYPGGAELTEEQMHKFAEVATKSLKGLRSMGMMMGAGKGDLPLYGNMLFVMHVDNSDEYLKTYARTIDEISKIGKAAKSPLFNYRVEKIEIDGKAGLKVTMNMAAFMGKDQPPEAKKALELMLGSQEEFVVYITAASPRMVVGSYLSQERLVEAIRTAQRADGQLSGDAGVKQTAAMLAAGSQWVAVGSPRGTMQFVGRMLAQMVPNLPTSIPEFPETAPIGFAMKLTPAGLETDLAIPADVLRAAAELVQQARTSGNQ